MTFSYSWRFVLKNNPSLQEIVVGNSSMGGRPAMQGSELVLDSEKHSEYLRGRTP